jgi:8-oxo-dGTP pyrophosphatase MutT (NUDIX family)
VTATIQAAGGLVTRMRDNTLEVLVVHRPRYDDWSLPKGKLEPGETPAEAAVREVDEETGARCVLGRALGTIQYVDRKGRDKIVHWWMMEVESTRPFVPNAEVDEIRWISGRNAEALLTYDSDRRLLAEVLVRDPEDPDDDLSRAPRQSG